MNAKAAQLHTFIPMSMVPTVREFKSTRTDAEKNFELFYADYVQQFKIVSLSLLADYFYLHF